MSEELRQDLRRAHLRVTQLEDRIIGHQDNIKADRKLLRIAERDVKHLLELASQIGAPVGDNAGSPPIGSGDTVPVPR